MTTLTAQVRKIVRETGSARMNQMYTNRYKTCRTVKFYGTFDDDLILDTAEAVRDFCEANNIPFKMKVNESQFLRPVIITLPLQD